VTSKTASKQQQLAKEARVRGNSGTFVKNKSTKELIEVEDLSTVIRTE
jgi:hypothetical protein